MKVIENEKLVKVAIESRNKNFNTAIKDLDQEYY